jgi:succinyl-diaminopimelate desuccinylase
VTAPSPVAQDLLWLCSIPSPTGEEALLADALEARFAARGIAVQRVRESLVVPVSRGTAGPRVVLGGHLDVVRTEHSGPPRIEGDRLYGPGASDMKGGLALMLDVLERHRWPNVDVTLVFYAGEEGAYAGNQLGDVLEAAPELAHADLAVLLEPCDNHLDLGCGGSVHGRVTFYGQTAHSARPWQGRNAIHAGAAFLSRVAALPVREHVVDGLTWFDSTSVTEAQGGRARNVVPDRFELNVNHRFGPRTTVAEAEAWLASLVEPERQQGLASLEIVDASPPAPPNREHPLVRALAESGAAEPRPKLGWTDAARFAALGVPAVNFGPGLVSQAHQRDEWASVAALEQGREILLRWLDGLRR